MGSKTYTPLPSKCRCQKPVHAHAVSVLVNDGRVGRHGKRSSLASKRGAASLARALRGRTAAAAVELMTNIRGKKQVSATTSQLVVVAVVAVVGGSSTTDS